MGSAEAIYAASPVWMQHLMVSLNGWGYRYRRANDGAITGHLKFLLESESWSGEEFRAYPTRSLRNILHIAFETIPYYQGLQRELSCQPGDFNSPEDIRKLPILEKNNLRGNERAFQNPAFRPGRFSHGFTSGTTGTPLNFLESQASFSKRSAFVARLRTWAGLSDPLHPRRIQFTGRNIIPTETKPKTRCYWRYNFFSDALLCSTTHLTPDTVPDYVRRFRAFKPHAIEGYPSAMLIVARVARRLGMELPRPRAIITTAETLLAEDRRELQSAFGCQVYNQYAASEPSCFWCDCEHGFMHMNPEYGISELVDAQGEAVGPGKEGEVVVTSFLNPVMPLLRYRLGDVAIAEADVPCACGRAMPRIRKVVGRLDDILFVPQWGYVGRLDPVFKGLENIIETQIIQETLDTIPHRSPIGPQKAALFGIKRFE